MPTNILLTKKNLLHSHIVVKRMLMMLPRIRNTNQFKHCKRLSVEVEVFFWLCVLGMVMEPAKNNCRIFAKIPQRHVRKNVPFPTKTVFDQI